MQQLSARVSKEVDDAITAYSDEHELSKSEATRELLQRGVEYESIQQENERLQRSLQQLIEQREEHQELVEYAEQEKSLAERRVHHEDIRRQAPIWRKIKWAIVGEPANLS